MKNNLLKKILALSLFVCGISVFVLHQSGYFSGGQQDYQGSHNGGVLPVKTKDSVAAKEDSLVTIMFSSKVAIPRNNKPELSTKPDSVNVKENALLQIMGSSKVVIIQDKAKISDALIQADTLKPFSGNKKQ